MRCPLMMAVAGALMLSVQGVQSAIPLRNPFWPIDYEGKRETISAEVRVVPKKPEEIRKEQEAVTARVQAAAAKAKAAAEAAEREKIITSEHWDAAYKALKIGGRVHVRCEDVYKASSVMINGKAYKDGDLISFTHGKNRFMWRLQGLTDGKTVRLDRVGARHLGSAAHSEDTNNSAKGSSK